MREKLISYVNLLFAGNEESDDIRQEILQNTLDRFDDLVADGKSPEAAYRLAIGGIGDINEILGQEPAPAMSKASPAPSPSVPRRDTPVKKSLRAVAVALYILCPLPLLIYADSGMDVFGLCGTLTFVAIATALIMLGAPDKVPTAEASREEASTPTQELWRLIRKIIDILNLIVYFVVSFATGFWGITWLILVIGTAVNGILRAIEDLKECVNHEN